MGYAIKPGMMKYCVVGNIVREHIDGDGVIRYGTKAFPGGRKVYLSRRLWGDAVPPEVLVMGLNRYKSRYTLERVPLDLIGNIRLSKTFKPRILELMAYDPEYPEMWWGHREEDRIGAGEYVRLLDRIKAGDREASERYMREVMSNYL